MDSIITQGIQITVQTHYYPSQSNPRLNQYFFVYQITITNKSDYTIQLLKRHWDITDALGIKRVVDGDGVVGEMPVIEPSQSYSYNSGCDFETEMGKMSGHYTVQKMVDGSLFNILIPEFIMEIPSKLN